MPVYVWEEDCKFQLKMENPICEKQQSQRTGGDRIIKQACTVYPSQLENFTDAQKTMISNTNQHYC